jgi:hypothetical protein
MTNNSRATSSRTLTACLTLALSLLGAPGAARAEARCTDQWLRGSYAFTIDGSIVGGPASLHMRGVAMTTFDGTGGLTQVDFATINGAPVAADWRAGTGTYRVNPDCTGSAEIFPVDGSPVIRLRLVVFDKGRQVRTTVVGHPVGSHGFQVQ